jgi:hypothetical protein
MWKVCGTRCPDWVQELGIRDRIRFGAREGLCEMGCTGRRDLDLVI